MPKLKANSFIKNWKELQQEVRRLADRIQIKQLKNGSVIVAFEILSGEESADTADESETTEDYS